jgi:hypothetical protein
MGKKAKRRREDQARLSFLGTNLNPEELSSEVERLAMEAGFPYGTKVSIRPLDDTALDFIADLPWQLEDEDDGQPT